MNTVYINVWVREDLVKYFFLGECEGFIENPEDFDNNYVQLMMDYNTVETKGHTCMIIK